MTINEQYETVKYAIDHNELDKLFLGKGEYRNNNLKHVPANIPCDISYVFKYGVYPLYEKGKKNIPQVLLNTLTAFLHGNAVEIWTAYSIVWLQYRNELTNSSPFCIISDELLVLLRNSIEDHKESLSSCREYVGTTEKDGLWGDIYLSNRSFQKKFEVSIL